MAQGAAPRAIGRYYVGEAFASGGMAAIHLGKIVGAGGFSRIVAIKCMLPHFAGSSSFALMFADEARLAARVRHPNVVPTFDVVMEGSDLCLVMEYVQGLTLAELVKLANARGEPIPPSIALAILRDALQGLHAAHEAVDDQGRPLGIVHRDVSPQNVLVGTDGIARVLDFGIARANVRLYETREGGSLKGKLAYMAPEQFAGLPAEPASDLYSAGVVLWEALTSQRLHAGESEAAIIATAVRGAARPPSEVAPELGTAFDAVVMRGLAREPRERFSSAREMALAVAESGPVAPAARVGEWIERLGAEPLAERSARVSRFQSLPIDGPPVPLASTDPETTLPAIAAAVPSSSGSGERSSVRPIKDAPPVPRGSTWRRITRVAVLAAVVGIALFFSTRARWNGAAASDAAPTTSLAVTTPPPPASTESSTPAPTTPPSASASAPEPAASTAVRKTPNPRPPTARPSPQAGLPDRL